MPYWIIFLLEIMFLPFYLIFLCIHLFCYILFCFASLSFYQYIIPDVFVSVQAMSKLNFTWKEHSLHIRKQSFLLDSSTCVIRPRTNTLVKEVSCVWSPEALFSWISLMGPPHSCGAWQLTWLFSVIFGLVILSHNAYLCYYRLRSVKSQWLSYFIGNTKRKVKETQSPNKWFTCICCLKRLQFL